MNIRLPAALLAAALTLAGCSSDSPAERPDDTKITRAKIRSWTQDHVVIVISRNNRVRLNETSVTPAELSEKLTRLGVEHPGRPVILLLQDGADEQAETFVRHRAKLAGLGPVERR